MASPLVGIAGVNSLLFASYGASKRIISPFPNLSLKEIAAAGAMAGAANAILASPGAFILTSFVHSSKPVSFQAPFRLFPRVCNNIDSCVCCWLCVVEMFKVRMQGQYGAATDKRLRDIMREMWSEFGFRKGVMRGYWVRLPFQPPGFHDMQRSH